MPHGIDFCFSCDRNNSIVVHVDKPDHLQALVEVLAQIIPCKPMQPPLAKSTMSLNLLGSPGQQWQTAKSGASTTQSPSSPPMQRCSVLSLPEACLARSSAGSVMLVCFSCTVCHCIADHAGHMMHGLSTYCTLCLTFVSGVL